jgi:molybdate transport system permease protein
METFLTETESTALWLTLKVAIWSVVMSILPAIAVSLALARGRFPGKSLLDGIVHLPLVLPPVVVGYLLLVLFSRNGPVGSWLKSSFDISIAFSWQGAALASAVMAFPLMVRAIRLSIEAIDPGLEAAARTLGAGRLRVLATITLPLALPGLLAGTILGFARSLGEFGATITFVSNIPGETQTLPLALFSEAQVPGGEDAALRLTLISVAIAFTALGASELLARRMRVRIGLKERGAS